MNGTAGRRTWFKRGTRPLAAIVSVACLPLLLIGGCQSSFIYFPRPYGPETVRKWSNAHQGRVLSYHTGEGRQQAYLQGNLRSPRHLWIVCGGNGSLALDWSDWLAANGPGDDAFLLVDFPGYGNNEGAPSPISVNLNGGGYLMKFYTLKGTFGSFDSRAPRNSWTIFQ